MGAVRETGLQGGEDRSRRGRHRAHVPLQPSRGGAAERAHRESGADQRSKRRSERRAAREPAGQEVHHRIYPKSRQGTTSTLQCFVVLCRTFLLIWTWLWYNLFLEMAEQKSLLLEASCFSLLSDVESHRLCHEAFQSSLMKWRHLVSKIKTVQGLFFF